MTKEVSIIDLVKVIRSKNAGPFELTFDIIFKDKETYEKVKKTKVITKELIAKLYHIPIEKVLYFVEFDPANAIKATIVRPVDSGSIGETDVYGAQQHAPLLDIKIPSCLPAGRMRNKEEKMREDLLKFIPEFNLIKDSDLKEKVLKVWDIALKAGGWEAKDLQRMPFTLLIDPCPCNMIEHIRGVVNVSVNAAEALQSIYEDKVKINEDYLVAGALLHDIGKLVEYKEENGKFIQSNLGKLVRHPISGVSLCYSQGIPEEVMHIIASHSWEGDRSKRTPEAIIVHHADFTNFEQFK